MARRQNYVDNKKFHAELSEYLKTLKMHRGGWIQEHPTIPDYVGQCILKIAQNFATKPNFRYMAYVEEMVSDAVENCIMYLDRFDHRRGTSAFSYYTQICYFAFLRRVSKENKQLYVMYKKMEQSGGIDNVVAGDGLQQGIPDDQVATMNDFIKNWEEKNLTKKVPKAPVAAANTLPV